MSQSIEAASREAIEAAAEEIYDAVQAAVPHSIPGHRAIEDILRKHFAGAGVEAAMVKESDAQPPQVLTTKQVATILKVSSRTVTKWYDSGRLKGYRIPGSQALRFPLENVVNFCKQHGMSTGDLEPQSETTLSKGG